MKISLVSIPVPDPVKAHEIYTSILGFESKEFDAEASLAIIASPTDPNGTAILLEPCKGSFAEKYQHSAFESNLPIMVLSTKDVKAELERLSQLGVVLRPELDKPHCGIVNVFEDGCGNLLMIEQENSNVD